MLEKLADFWLFQPWHATPRRHRAVPANDNLPIAPRARTPRRIRLAELACHWSLDDNGTGLICHWQIVPLKPTACEGPRARQTNHRAVREWPNLPTGSRKLTGRT